MYDGKWKYGKFHQKINKKTRKEIILQTKGRFFWVRTQIRGKDNVYGQWFAAEEKAGSYVLTPAGKKKMEEAIAKKKEGSSNNKYLEIYNASDESVDLGPYALSSCSNGCDVEGEWDYPNNVTFDAGTMLAAGDVYVVCHGSASDDIQVECDQTFTYLSNGDDVFALTYGDTTLDIIGDMGGDPGSGWDVCGESSATKDHTLVRKSNIDSGNSNWSESSGTDSNDCEWLVLEQNDWSNLGFHTYACTDVDADNVCDDVDDCVGAYDECGVCNGDGVDSDGDGVCDDVDDCVVEDGASQECGCNTGIADGACDCDGNVLDECNVCGGGGSGGGGTKVFLNLILIRGLCGLVNISVSGGGRGVS